MIARYDRTTVARPPDANYGRLRARTPEQVAEMSRMRRGGASMKAIADAFGLSVRTVYRYLTPAAGWFDVTVGDWTAVFVTEPGRAPVRVSAWRRVP